MSWEHKCSWLRSNPVTAARQFQHRLDVFFKYFIVGKAKPIELDLKADFPSFMMHYKQVEEVVLTNQSKFSVNSEQIDIAYERLQEMGPPEGMWDGIAPNTAFQEAEQVAEGQIRERDPMPAENHDNVDLAPDNAVGKCSELYARFSSELDKQLMSTEDYRAMMRSLNNKQMEVIKLHRKWCKDAIIALKHDQRVPQYCVFLSGPGGHHSVPSRNLHPLMVPPFLQPHPDLQSAVGNAPLSSKHPAQLPTTDCLLSIISPMGGQPSDAPALSPPSSLQQGGQSSNAPALSPPSPLPQGGQPIALALSPPSPPPQGSQPSDAPGLSPSSSTLLLCPSDSTLNICHLNSQSAVKTGKPETISDYILEQKLDIMILTETWLSESGHETSCNLMTPSGFVLKSYPRASKGGGIAVIFRESLVPHMKVQKGPPIPAQYF
ncbi:hypothetical protein ACOMHN_044735 [Nucella lapillus]